MTKVLMAGPSDTKSKGGMATVIAGLRSSKALGNYALTVHSTYIDGSLPVRFLYNILAFLRFLFRFWRYDIIYVHTASYGSFFRKALYVNTAKAFGKKIIIHIHGARFLEFYAELGAGKQNYLRKTLQKADAVIALSEKLRDDFSQTFGLRNCRAIENGIDPELYAGAVSKAKETAKSFVMFGRLGKRKGTYDLVRAVEIAAKQEKNIKCALAGDGEIDEVRSLVREKKLENNIELVGWAGPEKKLELLKKSATMVLPSYNEGMPMAILECMAAGKAIISTNIASIPEVVKEENGFLIEPGDVETLAQLLVRCCREPEMLEKMSKANRNKIEESFSIKRQHEKIVECFDDVMKKL